MAEKVASYGISFTGDGSDIERLLSGIKTSVARDVAELQRITSKVELFKDIGNALPLVERALESAKQKVQQFTAEIAKIEATGAKAPKELTKSLAEAERAVASANRELNNQTVRLNELQGSLARAGVNTKNLAAEQARLAEASKVATAAAAEQAAKQALGLKTLSDIAPEVNRLRAAYNTLKTSGTASAAEIGAAQNLLNQKLKELHASVTTAGGGFKSLGTDASAAFSGLALKVTGAVAAVGAVGSALAAVTDAAKAYNNELARVGTVTTLGKQELSALGAQARALAQELGINVIDALKGLYETLRGGVSPENSIEVLRLGALAAKAAISDTATGVQAAAVLIDAFGVDVKDLAGALDIVVRSAQTGGPTLAEFAANAAQLGNAARATGADFKEVSAVLNVMTDASNDAAGSATLLAKILLSLDKPETQAGLRKLGLEGRSLVETFRGLDARGLKIAEFLELGIVNAKAAVALTALTNNAAKLPAALESAATAAGAVSTAVARIFDTPEERKKRFDAALEETKIKLGEMAGAAGGTLVHLNSLLGLINGLIDSANRYNAAISEQNAKLFEAAKRFLGFGESAQGAAVGVKSFQQASIPLQSDLDKINQKIDKAGESLSAYGKSLSEVTAVLQKAVVDQIAALEQRAATEISLLDKSIGAQVATAAKTVEIQNKLHADVLTALINNAEKVRVAVEAGEKLITDERTKAGKKEAEIAQEVAALRVKSLDPVLTAYQKHYESLIGQAQSFQATINNIEREQASVADAAAAKARAARLSGLTDLQQYATKVQQVDQLIAKGREAAATQGIDAAKKYFQQADQISESIKGEVISDGLVVISEFQAQQKQIQLLKRSSDAYNESLADSKKKAEEGAAGTKAALAETAELIKGIQEKLDAAKKTLSQGISIKINEEIEGLEAARAKIDDLVKTREQIIRIRYENAGAPGETPSGFNRGGPVQRFASGGPVFARPSWSKVPGSGNTDTVAAALPVGAFVIRKAASQFYGDSAMSRLARGYATGGKVDSKIQSALDALRYASYVKAYMRGPFWALAIKSFENQMDFVGRHPSDASAIEKLLKSAREAAGSVALSQYYGGAAPTRSITANLLDYAEWLKQNPYESDMKTSRNRFRARQFATGGPVGSDTVPAWVTPGEWIVPPQAVRALGSDFLRAVNSMQIRPARFATGGPVPGTAIPSRGTASVGGQTVNITINATGNLDDPRARRELMAEFSEVLRRSGQRLANT